MHTRMMHGLTQVKARPLEADELRQPAADQGA